MTSMLSSLKRLLCLGALAFLPNGHAADDAARTAGPYVPTPQVIVDRMLQFAGVTAADFVIDLGSGDGRIVRTAARVIGASGYGADIDAALVARSNAAAQEEGIAAKARFIEQDIFKADLSKATVVTLYVLPEMMNSLQPKLLSELKSGTRIVSHDYRFEQWLPDRQVSFDVPEKAEAVGFSSTSINLWIVPANVDGRWRLRVDGVALPRDAVLDFRQRYQYVNGITEAEGRRNDIGNVRLSGDVFEFAADLGGKSGGERHTYRGKVVGDTMEGEVTWGAGANARRHKWKATRIDASQPLSR